MDIKVFDYDKHGEPVMLRSTSPLQLYQDWAAILIVTALVGCGGEVGRTSGSQVSHIVRSSEEQHAGPKFEDSTDAAGLDFMHDPGPAGRFFFPEIMGSGVALLDYDRDGDLDIYLINGTGAAPHPSATKDSGAADDRSRASTNRLYRHEDDGRFVDVTSGSGLDDAGYGMGTAVGDVNNDGYPDVYVTNYGPDKLFLNRGDGTFADITLPAGIDNPDWGTSVCFTDFDRDGRLDIYVTNYVHNRAWRRCRGLDKKPDYCQPSDFPAVKDRLYRNVTPEIVPREGNDPVRPEKANVRFLDVSAKSGIAVRAAPGLGVVSADLNGDRWPDFYVANDGDANFLWINRRDGTFRDEAIPAGVAFDDSGRPQAGMGIALGDLNGDGRLDLFVTHLSTENNTLYAGTSWNAFEDQSVVSGLDQPSRPLTGFGTVAADVDHDMDLDLLVVNGRIRRDASRKKDRPASLTTGTGDDDSRRAFWQPYAEPNSLYLNDGAGHFTEKFHIGGQLSEELNVSRGLACGDIDNDGDIDFLVTNTAGRARLFKGTGSQHGNWVLVRAVEPRLGGRDAYGAVVTVVADEQRLWRVVNPASSYLSSQDPRAHFGLGRIERIERVEILWPDGTDEVFSVTKVNRIYTLRHGEGNPP